MCFFGDFGYRLRSQALHPHRLAHHFFVRICLLHFFKISIFQAIPRVKRKSNDPKNRFYQDVFQKHASYHYGVASHHQCRVQDPDQFRMFEWQNISLPFKKITSSCFIAKKEGNKKLVVISMLIISLLCFLVQGNTFFLKNLNKFPEASNFKKLSFTYPPGVETMFPYYKHKLSNSKTLSGIDLLKELDLILFFRLESCSLTAEFSFETNICFFKWKKRLVDS